mmetsp:Transcript_7361/g.22763  ORF Transcript_7361/g.22763 Transcript_7361/m.22763 type:complete len:209 (-) Transcript_7361:828-1454(-)|eukprot:scaffold221738_cov31-Tisochrysis_lutea.AAC.1
MFHPPRQVEVDSRAPSMLPPCLARAEARRDTGPSHRTSRRDTGQSHRPHAPRLQAAGWGAAHTTIPLSNARAMPVAPARAPPTPPASQELLGPPCPPPPPPRGRSLLQSNAGVWAPKAARARCARRRPPPQIEQTLPPTAEAPARRARRHARASCPFETLRGPAATPHRRRCWHWDGLTRASPTSWSAVAGIPREQWSTAASWPRGGP